MTIQHRHEAIRRAKEALRALEENPSTSRRDLGKARDLLNTTHNSSNQTDVDAAVHELEEQARQTTNCR